MSRRESRVSINVRQNDALVEFENFKKKFLLANKHITKLNSTLSVRIEELNAQLSTLYVENLRLRASEIALAAELKREREKTKKVMAEAEDATLNLSKHLNYLRQTLNIQATSPTPAPSPPRACRPPANPNPSPNSPQGNRISRPPNIPGIYEDEEPCTSSSDEKPPSPVRRKSKPKQRLSASKLPLPSRVSPSPPPLSALPAVPLRLDLVEASSRTTRRKPSRRQSGLLNMTGRDAVSESLSPPRPASPAFGSPIRREAAFVEEEDGEAVDVDVDVMVDKEADFESIMRREKRKGKGKERETERDSGVESMRPRERKRAREEEDLTVEGAKLKLQDVTNSPRGHTVLPPIENAERDRTTSEAGSTSTASRPARPFLATTSTTPPPPPYLPTPRTSSSPGSPTITASETEGSVAPLGGRERRTRKSVNYAEPKLNTKMRKPDPQSGNIINNTSTVPKKRSSTSAVMATFTPVDDNENDADNDTEARSSLEGYTNISGHRLPSSLTPTAASIPLPPSRPTSSASMSTLTPAPSARPSLPSSSATTSVKRKKSRPYLILDDDESDGAQADAEYGGGRLGLNGWVNVEGRRRSVQNGPTRKGRGVVEVMGRVEGDDERRHSMAV